MDQVTATALAVALVVNVLVLLGALAWARRQRLEADSRVAAGARADRGSDPARASGPWWSARDAARTGGSDGVAGVGLAGWDSVGEAAGAGTEPARSPGDDPTDVAVTDDAAGRRGADVLASLEGAVAWRGILALEAARVTRYGRPATVVLAELEGVDRLAARLGPEAVDRLLPAIAGTLRREARASDRIARLGTARFGVLLPETDEVAAINWVERVREATDLWLDASAVALRLAFGWAELAPDGEVESVLETARERLDAERHGGRPNGRADAAARSDRRNDRPTAPERAQARRRPATNGSADGAPKGLPGASSSPLAAS